MISATYFGEITELSSRAVWYSDGEDDDEEEFEANSSNRIDTLEPLNHETLRSTVQLNFRRETQENYHKFSTCVISLSSSQQFKSFRFGNNLDSYLLGSFDNAGKAFALREPKEMGIETKGEFTLWLLFDASDQYISNQWVGYFVEALREKLKTEFNLNHSNPIIILSQQFSNSEHLEYLSNCPNSAIKLPFAGHPILPPSLIKKQFESALFEQLTLSAKPALITCLPHPKNFWFDKTKNWPEVPDHIIEHRLNDDNLEKTLIFT